MFSTSVGEIFVDEGRIVMSLGGGCPIHEDDERDPVEVLRSDLGVFETLAKPYLTLRVSNEVNGYSAERTYVIEIKQSASLLPDWNINKAEKGYVTQIVDYDINVTVEAVVHNWGHSATKVLTFKAGYWLHEPEELAEIVHELTRRGFSPKKESEGGE